MGYSSIIYITGSVVLFGIMSLNINTVVGDQLTQSLSYYEETQVRNLNNSVTEMLASSVSSDATFRSKTYSKLSILDGTAYYRVIDTVIATDSLIKIEVIGNFGKTPKVTTAYFTVQGATVDLPEHMKYAVSTSGSLNISGNSKVIDYDNSGLNADIYVRDLNLSGNSKIEGLVKYTSNFNGSVNAIVPHSNPDNLPKAQKVTTTIPMPVFKPDDFIAKATVKYFSDLTIKNSTLTLGTKQNPAIVYISGNMSIEANAKIEGFGVFIVKGDVKLNGNTNFGTLDPDKSSLGIYAGSNILASGNNTYYGQMYSNGDINLSGNCDIVGSVSAKGNVNMSGNNSVAYKPANVILTEDIWASTGGGASIQRAAKRLYYE